MTPFEAINKCREVFGSNYSYFAHSGVWSYDPNGRTRYVYSISVVGPNDCPAQVESKISLDDAFISVQDIMKQKGLI